MQTDTTNTCVDSRCVDPRSAAATPLHKGTAARLLSSGIKQFVLAPFSRAPLPGCELENVARGALPDGLPLEVGRLAPAGRGQIAMSNISLYAVTVLVWGSTWLAIEYQLGVVAPEVSISYRYAAAAVLLFAWCKHRRLPLSFGWRQHGLFVGLGAFLFCLNYILTYYAQQHLTSALTAIAFSTMLWMNIGNARLFFGVHADRRVLLGALCGIVGILVLFLPEVGSMSWADTTLLGGAYCLGGAFLASLGNMISQAAQRARLPVVQSNAYGMLYGAGLTAAIAAQQGLPFNFDFSVGLRRFVAVSSGVWVRYRVWRLFDAAGADRCAQGWVCGGDVSARGAAIVRRVRRTRRNGEPYRGRGPGSRRKRPRSVASR